MCSRHSNRYFYSIGCCEQNNEPLGDINGRQFLDQLRDFQLCYYYMELEVGGVKMFVWLLAISLVPVKNKISSSKLLRLYRYVCVHSHTCTYVYSVS